MINTVKHTRIMQRLVPLWNVMPHALKVSKGLCVEESPDPLVKRAGRNLTQNDYNQLSTSALLKGGEQNVNIQFGFLGGFGGVGVPGESSG